MPAIQHTSSAQSLRLGRSRLAAVSAVLVVSAVLSGCSHSTAKTPVALPTPSPTLAAPTTPPPPPPPPPVFPLTGLPVGDGTTADRAALSVKVDNVAGAFPQRGLNQADIVVDALVEGGLTRLFAVYQSQNADVVGPIRSARPVDADLLRLVGGGIFAYSGAADAEIAPVIEHGDAVRVTQDSPGAPYFRGSDHAPPHNLFASTSGLYKSGFLQASGLKPPPTVFHYGPLRPSWALAHGVRVPISGVTTAAWTWDGRQYLRTQDGTPDVLADGVPISTDNVVVMSIAIAGTGIRDAAGNEDPLDVVIGSGTCWVLRSGRLQAGTWTRPSVAKPMELRDPSGTLLSLQPGRTWVELLPRPQSPTLT